MPKIISDDKQAVAIMYKSAKSFDYGNPYLNEIKERLAWERNGCCDSLGGNVQWVTRGEESVCQIAITASRHWKSKSLA
jgi:hypothetical protein